MILDDDWLYPKRSVEYSYIDHDKPKYYIMRERKIQCSFYGKAPTEWAVWGTYDDAEERDREYSRLKETTIWSLRCEDEIPCYGRRVSFSKC